MLIRDQGGQWLAVTQPAHAAVSGQLARAWGNAHFGDIIPRDDVILGAVLHDIGWLEWEREPTFNSATGLPHAFMQLPTHTHVAVWRSASQLARPFSRYASLLVSMHGTGLYGFHDYTRDTADEAQAARAFVSRELEYQQSVIDDMSKDPASAPYVSPENIKKNRKLISVWDAMSLAICGGVSGDRTFQDVPTADEPVSIVMRPSAEAIIVEPWPFRSPSLTLSFEARTLHSTFSDEHGMRTELEKAQWKTLSTTLRDQ